MAKASRRSSLVVSLVLAAALLTGAGGALMGSCGPFTDVAADAFCPFVLEIFYLGITTGTTPTTYDPSSSVTRLQMAVFLSRTVDGVLKRGSRRAALEQTWIPSGESALAVTTVGGIPTSLKCDGLDVWVANQAGSVSRVRAADGRLLETWTGTTQANVVLVAAGRVFAAGSAPSGRLYRIDPSQAAGIATTVASNLGGQPRGITYDGQRIWTANGGPPASVSIVTPGATLPWTVTAVTTGFQFLNGAIYDGANVWVADNDAEAMLKLDSGGAILQTVTINGQPQNPVFDGANIWVPVESPDSVVVVRASNGAILATLTGNGLGGPIAAAFDGERVLTTNVGANSVSLWKAANFGPLGSFSTGVGTAPQGATSDGINFWIALTNAGKLGRL